MALTGIYGAIDPGVAMATIHRALDAGVHLFDTAALYGAGANEELLGRALGGREDVTIVTKVGLAAAGDRLVRDSAPAAVRASVDASLRRLRRERIDLLLQHRPDPAVPDAELAGTVRRLIDEGKVAAFGLSGTPTSRIAAFAGVAPVSAVQNELSVVERENVPDVAAAGRAGAMLMAHSPLGRGLATRRAGDPDPGDLRSGMAGFRDGGRDRDAALLRAVGSIAASHAVPNAAVALAWTLRLGANVVPIPGARSPAHVDQFKAASLVALTPEEVEALEAPYAGGTAP